jgi:hypothetical protein
MLYVSSSKTLSFKATATGKPNSKESKEVRETPTRKQSIKSVALKRGSGGDKENLCNGVQLSKLVTREFDRYGWLEIATHPPRICRCQQSKRRVYLDSRSTKTVAAEKIVTARLCNLSPPRSISRLTWQARVPKVRWTKRASN